MAVRTPGQAISKAAKDRHARSRPLKANGTSLSINTGWNNHCSMHALIVPGPLLPATKNAADSYPYTCVEAEHRRQQTCTLLGLYFGFCSSVRM